MHDCLIWYHRKQDEMGNHIKEGVSVVHVIIYQWNLAAQIEVLFAVENFNKLLVECPGLRGSTSGSRACKPLEANGRQSSSYLRSQWDYVTKR